MVIKNCNFKSSNIQTIINIHKNPETYFCFCQHFRLYIGYTDFQFTTFGTSSASDNLVGCKHGTTGCVHLEHHRNFVSSTFFIIILQSSGKSWRINWHAPSRTWLWNSRGMFIPTLTLHAGTPLLGRSNVRCNTHDVCWLYRWACTLCEDFTFRPREVNANTRGRKQQSNWMKKWKCTMAMDHEWRRIQGDGRKKET